MTNEVWQFTAVKHNYVLYLFTRIFCCRCIFWWK